MILVENQAKYFSRLGVENSEFLYGVEIDGTLAAVKHLVDNQGRYFSNIGLGRSEYLNDKSIEALAVSDYLHLETEQEDYNKNNNRL